MRSKNIIAAMLCLLFPLVSHAQKKDFNTLIETGSQLMLSPSLDDAQKILKKEGFSKKSAGKYSLTMDSKLSYVMLYDAPATKAPIDTVAFMLKVMPANVEALIKSATVLGFETVDVSDRKMRLLARETTAHETVLAMFPMNDEETKYVVFFTTRQCYERKYGTIKQNGKPYFKKGQTTKTDTNKGGYKIERGKKPVPVPVPKAKQPAPSQKKGTVVTPQKSKSSSSAQSKVSMSDMNRHWQVVTGNTQTGPLEWETMTVEKTESFSYGDVHTLKYTVNVPMTSGEGSEAINATVISWLARLMGVDGGQLNTSRPREAVEQLLERCYLQQKNSIQLNRTAEATGEMYYLADNYTIELTRGLNDWLAYETTRTTFEEGIHQDVNGYALMVDPSTGRRLGFNDVFKAEAKVDIGDMVASAYNKDIVGTDLAPAIPEIVTDNFLLLEDKIVFILNICDSECEPKEYTYGYKKVGKYLKN